MERSKGLDIEKALKAAGSWDRFQMLVLFMSLISAVPNAFVSLHFVYSQYEPHHRCNYPTEYLSHGNNTVVPNSKVISTMIPFELDQRGERVQSQCKMYDRNYSQYPVDTWVETFDNLNDTETINCVAGFSYELPKSQETAVMEFSMVCDDDWKAPLAVSLCGVGKAIGCILGFTADWYGRRPVFIITCAIQVLAELVNALSWNFPVYCIAQVLCGASSVTNYNVFFVLATEVTDHKWRNLLSLSSSFGFALGYCSVPLVAYLVPRWRYLIGVMSALGAIVYIPCCWYFPESPRWLAQKGRSDDSIKSLRVIARVNRRTKIFEETLEGQEKKSIIAKNNITSSTVAETIRVLLKSGLASRVCVTAYGWLVTTLAYFSFSLFSSDFSQDRFINFLLGGLVELPAFTVVYFMLKYLGRPRTTLILMIVCGVSSIILPFIPSGLQYLSTIFAMLGKGSIAAVFFAWYLISTEVVPTLQRSSSLCICAVLAQLGSFCSPYLMYYRKYNYWMPNVGMGVSCISSGLLAIFFLPETLGVNLPDTVQEAKENKRFYGFHLMRKFRRQAHPTKTSDDDEHEKVSML